MRIALVGARRVRQGLGTYVARFLAKHGAEVCGFLGTSTASVEQAAEDLRSFAGLEPPGFTDLADLLATEPAALCILSPHPTHEPYLEAALDAGLHVLCEKPLVWGRPDAARRTAELCTSFAERGLLLVENCQWPCLLSGFEELHPGVLGTPVETFGMRLTPSSRGRDMIGDALPHPLSLLQALVPEGPPELADVAFSTRDPRAEELVVSFRYRTPGGTVATRVDLVRGDRLPREAAFTINGCEARRVVDLTDYSIRLASDTREVPVVDPLEARVVDFLSALRSACAGQDARPDPAIVPRMQMLEQLLVTFEETHR